MDKNMDRKIFRRIFAIHYVGIVVLLINVFLFTQDFVAQIVQVVLAVIIFIHNLDDKKLVNKVINYTKNIEYAYKFDELTGLYSRNSFFDNNSTITKIILVDIDRFSKINDVYGSEFGNQILIRVAQQLKELKKIEECQIFRLNGDQFAICLNNNYSNIEIINLIKIFIEMVNKNPLKIDNDICELDFTFGIGKSMEEAEIGLGKAKQENILYGFFIDDGKDLEISKKFCFYKRKIKWALNNNKIKMLYQPIVDINQQIIKYEALVRIEDVDGSLISPYFFLEIAKQIKKYDELSYIAIMTGLNKASEIKEKVSVNFSYRDMINEKLLNEVENFIKEKGLTNLVFEVLETEEIIDYYKVLSFIDRFKKLGCLFALDDYGSGYSSFEYIMEMNLDYIKIDASLIKNIHKNEKDRLIVTTIVNMAKNMNLKTIAEYVENEEIYNVCKELGIDEYQGYFFSKPIKI